MSALPAGYVDLGFCAMHISEIRQHTTCVHRFQQYLPLALELQETRPNSAEARAVIAKADRSDLLMVTVSEIADVLFAEADDLEGRA